jgi:hypothetical protein
MATCISRACIFPRYISSRIIKTLPRLRRRKRRLEKVYFGPPAEAPTPPIARHRYVVRHIGGHPPAKFGRRAGPGRVRKTGSKFLENPKKTPPFLGDREKKVPSGSRRRAHNLRGSRRNRPPGASAARTRKTA